MSARRALAIGLAYEQKIRQAIDSVRRDVSQVDWVADVLRQLDESLHHLRERTSAETEIAEAVRVKADIATPEDRPALAELEERISECQQRHLLLHRTVMNANRAYLDEQARQAFRSRSLASLPDMEAQVLFGALCLNESSASELLDDLLMVFSTPSPQTLCDLDLLQEILLAPRRAEDEEHEELQAPDTEEIATGEQRFSEEDVRFVQLFLDAESRGGRRLSDLLDVARQRGFSIDLQTLVALEVLREYGEPTGTGALSIDRADKDFENAACYGDDLLLVDRVAEEVAVG